jgi:hypothetical protein
MATTTTFYIPQALKKAEVVASDFNEDDAIAFTLDDNPNTSWISPSSAAQIITIDTHFSANWPTVDAFGLWIRNYETDWGESGEGVKIALGWSNGVSSGYSYGDLEFVENNGGAIFIHNESPLSTFRYFQIVFNDLPTCPPNIEVGQLFLMQTIALEARGEFPLRDQPAYLNKFSNLENGRRLSSPRALDSVRTFERNFSLIDSTNKGYWDAIIDGTQGGRKPFLFQEGTNVNEIVWVYLLDHSIQEIDHDYFRGKMRLQEVPYIRENEVI